MSKAPKTKPRNLGEALASVVTKATVKWTATKKSEERRPSYISYRRVRMTAARGLSQKDAAAQVMEAAYMAASANGTLPATARQVMYAARPKIEALTSGRRLDDQYFCQTLLPDYMDEHNPARERGEEGGGRPQRGQAVGCRGRCVLGVV